MRNRFWKIILASTVLVLFAACSSEERDMFEQETLTMRLIGGLTPFDYNDETTRASQWTWADGATLYLQLYNASTRMNTTAIYNQSTGLWDVKQPTGTLAANGKCEVYYFDTTTDKAQSSIAIGATVGVYGDVNGTYTKSGSSLSISASLIPLTSRLQFVSPASTNVNSITVQGISAYTAYDATNNQFSISADAISNSVSTSTGTTDYIYGVFTDTSARQLTLTNSTDGNLFFFTRTFGSNVLKAGKSGKMTIPTKADSKGWTITENTVKAAYAVEQDGILTFYYDYNRESHTTGTIYDVDTELGQYHFQAPRWCSSKITKAIFDDSFNDYTLEDASSMFSGCSNLAEVVNFKELNTSETTNMSYMFENCSKLANIDLSGIDCPNVEYMDGMFYRCTNLKKIDLSNLDTKSLKSMNSTFSNSGLETICLYRLNTSNVISFNGLFSSCAALTEIDLSSFNTSSVSDMGGMFSGCTNLKTIYVGSGWNTANVTDGKNMFMGCTKLVGGNGTKCDGFINVDYDFAKIDNNATHGYLTYISLNDAYAVAEGGVLTFYYDDNKEERTGTVYKIETEYVGDGNFPAWRGTSFTKVIFDSSFASYQPTSTARWFHNCSAVTAFEGMKNLNTSKTINMSSMFYGCQGLKSLDLSSMNTSSTTTMATMFYECNSLENLDLSSFNTDNVTAMTAMFYGCTSLKELNLSSFNTSKVKDMQYMFFNCGNLTSLDLSSFNTSKVANMERMFQDCVTLKTIYASSQWNNKSITNGVYMFYGCLSLVGGAGTVCDGILRTDYTYARIDSQGTSGYFTDRSSPISPNENDNQTPIAPSRKSN